MFSKGDSETGAVGTTRARAARRPALQRAAAALIAVIIAAALVGCSGDDDSGGDTTTTTTTPLVIPTTVPITIPALGSPDPADAQHAGEVALVADDLPEGWEDMGDLADDLAFLPRGAEECKPLEPFVATGAMSARVVSPRFASEQAVAGLVGYVQVYADEGSAEAALAAFAAGRTGACLARALEASVTTTGPAQVQPLTMAPTPLSVADSAGYTGTLSAAVGGAPFSYAFGYAAATSGRTLVLVAVSGVNPAWDALETALGAMAERA